MRRVKRAPTLNLVAIQWKSLATACLLALFAARALAGGPTLDAQLLNPVELAKKKAASVQVRVTGIELIDPASVGEKPKAGQGHLHYRVDDGPVIATTATKLSFHELTPGQHHIVVLLAGNDHRPLGPSKSLDLEVPSSDQ